jgi:mycofactocin glycosyltransferase
VARPTVSVIVPFAGSGAELRSLVARLARLRLREGDEVLVADNSAQAAARSCGEVRIVAARRLRAPGFARNVAARQARGEWIVFIDADTVAAPDLLDAYFSPGPGEDVGVLAGGIDDLAEVSALAARYVSARGMMAQETTLRHAYGGHAKTANCAVRRSAFETVGGFDESARWGEDADLMWRLRDAGWRMEERTAARVAHRNRATLRALLGQQFGHGAGAAWLERRHPGSSPAPGPRELAGQARHFLRRAWRARRAGERDEAAFSLVDLGCRAAFEAGRLRSNQPGEHTS